MKFIKDMNINVYGLSEHAKKDHIEVDFSSNTAVIMGSEEHGIRKKTKEICDQLVRLSSNKINSAISLSRYKLHIYIFTSVKPNSYSFNWIF